METQDPQYYAILMGRLNAEQTKGLQSVLEIAGKKQAQYASQALERQGGKHFAIFAIGQLIITMHRSSNPIKFNFIILLLNNDITLIACLTFDLNSFRKL